MVDEDDPRYQRLFQALYLGELPSEPCASGASRFRAASDLSRLAISQALASQAPRASYYGTCLLGVGLIDGVGRQLVEATAGPGEFDAKVRRAAHAYCRAARLAALQALFVYDDLLALRLPPYAGADRAALRASAGLPEEFSLHAFEYDVVSFSQLVERFRGAWAPAEMLRRYAPEARRQTLAAYASGGSARVKEVVR